MQDESLKLINEHRREIDRIDALVVALLNERAFHSLTIRNLKPAAGMNLYDPSRENLIFEKIAAQNDGPLTDANLKEIYETLLKVMKEAPDLPVEPKID